MGSNSKDYIANSIRNLNGYGVNRGMKEKRHLFW